MSTLEELERRVAALEEACNRFTNKTVDVPGTYKFVDDTTESVAATDFAK